MWFSVVYNFIDNDTRHHSGQNVVDSRGAAEWVRNKFWPLWWRVSLSVKLYTTLNQIRFIFLPQYQRNEIFVLTTEHTDSDLKVHALHYARAALCTRCIIFRARAEKGIAWHIDASSVVETLIYHGKLANQIARLAAIVVKS